MKNKFIPIILITVVTLIFFKSFLFNGKFPIPADTIIGIYHPFRDLYAKNYPNGVPFKNFLITDPVRQQYPWRDLAVSLEKKLELPLWNPYSLSGTPLLANFQSAVFYPFNLLFLVFPFSFGWSILIFMQPLLAGVFLYLYLNNLKLNRWASLLGSLSFIFSGFFVSWLEWGTVGHTALWLPLILLSVDKIFSFQLATNEKLNPSTSLGTRIKNSKLQVKNKKLVIWSLIFVSSLTSSFFAGHLQTFFYLFILSVIYILVRHVQYGKNFRVLILFFIFYLSFFILTFVQWFPTMQLILSSAREVDQIFWQKEGWFIPWQHLIQFLAPDFFGNPTTLNYWGIWNYAEFVGYVGIIPLLMGLFGLFFRHDKKTYFYGTLFFLSLIFSLPTFFAKLPYILNVPFISTAQPTRLLFMADFSLAVLAALGFDYFLREKKKIFYPIVFLTLIFAGLWTLVSIGENMNFLQIKDLLVVKRNLIFPTIIFIAAIVVIVIDVLLKNKSLKKIIPLVLIIITVFDLLRFADKFTPFAESSYLFPNTATTSFLQKKSGYSRIMSVDKRIFPPNFSVIYRLYDIGGYDPLYLRSYGELTAASERGKPDISPPFGFNRIITPQNFESKMVDLLGVKYVLSLSALNSPKLKKVFQEGQTRIYENQNVLSRTFFVEQVLVAKSKEESINMMFDKNINLEKQAILEDSLALHLEGVRQNIGKSEIIEYLESKILIETENKGDGFLVLTDTFYPSWHVSIDGKEAKIYRTDYNFRGVIVPQGEHRVEFFNRLF